MIEETYAEAGCPMDLLIAEMERIDATEAQDDIVDMINSNEAPWIQVPPHLITDSPQRYPPKGNCRTLEDEQRRNKVPEYGILLLRPPIKVRDTTELVASIVPNSLTRPQLEWLLETAWAQDAFLSSYLLSITDNRQNFRNVRTLTIARISSRLLHKICRKDFWESLPKLSSFSVRVIADWRDVGKDRAGEACTTDVEPSIAVTGFHHLLNMFVAPRKSIKTLSVGWVQGGEHAQGCLARHKHLLPAPMACRDRLLTVEQGNSTGMLALPHVEHFTLENCWLTPKALEDFVITHTTTNKLAQLTLESVSLSAHTLARDAVWIPKETGFQWLQHFNRAGLTQFVGRLVPWERMRLAWTTGLPPPGIAPGASRFPQGPNGKPPNFDTFQPSLA